jgi:hypothetical protein
MRSRGRLLVLISSSSAQQPSWALNSCPDRGHPTLHGWWAPIALRYINTWGLAARSTRFTRSHCFHRQTLTRSERVRSQRWEAATVFTSASAPPSPATGLRRQTSLHPPHRRHPHRRHWPDGGLDILQAPLMVDNTTTPFFSSLSLVLILVDLGCLSCMQEMYPLDLWLVDPVFKHWAFWCSSLSQLCRCCLLVVSLNHRRQPAVSSELHTLPPCRVAQPPSSACCL